MKVSAEVQRTYQRIVAHQGKAFSFEALTLFIESCRVKRLRFEQERTPVAITGSCVALQDVDLIITRRGLDEILTLTATLHELAHLLLGHVPRFADGSSTSTYEEFQHHLEAKHMVYRTHRAIYTDAREQDAETLATLLLECIRQEKTSPHECAKDVYGWINEH